MFLVTTDAKADRLTVLARVLAYCLAYALAGVGFVVVLIIHICNLVLGTSYLAMPDTPSTPERRTP